MKENRCYKITAKGCDLSWRAAGLVPSKVGKLWTTAGSLKNALLNACKASGRKPQNQRVGEFDAQWATSEDEIVVYELVEVERIPIAEFIKNRREGKDIHI